jgi:hypothetical protein
LVLSLPWFCSGSGSVPGLSGPALVLIQIKV